MKNIKPFLLLLSLAFSCNLFAQDVQIKNLTDINSDELDFSPMPYRNGIMYTSGKTDRFLKCPVYDDNKGDYVDLYYAEKNPDGTWKEPVVLKGKVNGKYNDGAPTFFPGDERMIFSRNNLSGKNDSNVIDLKLYVGDLQEEQWVNVTTEFPIDRGFFNSDDWSTAHPALSSDGKFLVFSTNKPYNSSPDRPSNSTTLGPDGKQSMDLWGSRFEDGVWTVPRPLGPSINTPKNEIFPTFYGDNHLFFSSDGHKDSGDLDIYAASYPGFGDEWNMIGNIGAPFNTNKDDMGFITINGGAEGYLASDRDASNAKGRDDIYEWSRDITYLDAIIKIVDKETGEPLANSIVNIDPSISDENNVLDQVFGGADDKKLALSPLTFKTDENGLTEVFRILSNTNFNILASNKPLEYNDNTANPDAAALAANFPEPYIIELERSEPPTCKLTVRVVKDGTYDERISGAEIKLANISTYETDMLPRSGYEGETSTEIFINDDKYEITASLDPYYPNTVMLKDYKDECRAKGEVLVIVPLKSPNIVYLKPIFYSFDRYYIRSPDAKATLDSLAILMNTYPTLHIRLEGNTDSRGPSEYNERLSINRAKAAYDYLVDKKGIAKSRLTTGHNGEGSLANGCTDDKVCPESDHQHNRRVEPKAMSHEEPNVRFELLPYAKWKVVSDRK